MTGGQEGGQGGCRFVFYSTVQQQLSGHTKKDINTQGHIQMGVASNYLCHGNSSYMYMEGMWQFFKTVLAKPTF